MGLTMAERKAVTRQMARRYEAATKAEKGRMLDELCALTGWSRSHARRALAEVRGGKHPPPRKQRARIYGPEVLEPLRRIWATLDGPCGKRLAPFMAEIVEALERFGELELTEPQRNQLLRISAATIDRLLAPDRDGLRLRPRPKTKPGSILRAQIPIRTFAEWDGVRPGFFEVDLVSHDGGHAAGQFAQTLCLTDVATGWTEVRALRNRAHRWVIEALADLEPELPFPLLGIDSDNGSEFINDALFGFCSERGITFTRSRPWRKNDACFVEQKNWTVVRQASGYLRYDTPAELAVLRRLYRFLVPYVNFFQPQMRLVDKTRLGAKLIRRHDRAQTPHQRLIVRPEVPDEAKALLSRRYLRLNPAELKREIGRCQDRLLDLARTRDHKAWKGVSDSHPWRASFVRQRMPQSRSS